MPRPRALWPAVTTINRWFFKAPAACKGTRPDLLCRCKPGAVQRSKAARVRATTALSRWSGPPKCIAPHARYRPRHASETCWKLSRAADVNLKSCAPSPLKLAEEAGGIRRADLRTPRNAWRTAERTGVRASVLGATPYTNGFLGTRAIAHVGCRNPLGKRDFPVGAMPISSRCWTLPG
jgi:hypothetical protein